MLEYNDPDDYFDVSNHEVDRQDNLEYEVRAAQLNDQKPNVSLPPSASCMKGKVHDFTHRVSED